MKVLFVCWANVGRSQMAAEIYNRLTNSHDADSAGTEVMHPGKTLAERRERRGGTYVLDVMQEDGVDVSGNVRTQLDQAMLDGYDLIVSMAQPAYTPGWLSQHPKYVYWDIEDPMDFGVEQTRKAKLAIEAKIKKLLT